MNCFKILQISKCCFSKKLVINIRKVRSHLDIPGSCKTYRQSNKNEIWNLKFPFGNPFLSKFLHETCYNRDSLRRKDANFGFFRFFKSQHFSRITKNSSKLLGIIDKNLMWTIIHTTHNYRPLRPNFVYRTVDKCTKVSSIN